MSAEPEAVSVARQYLADHPMSLIARYVVEQHEARERAQAGMPEVVAEARAWLDSPIGPGPVLPFDTFTWRFARALIASQERIAALAAEVGKLRPALTEALDMWEQEDESDRAFERLIPLRCLAEGKKTP